MTERRRDARIAGSGVRARLRLGHRLIILDVSVRGALVEGPCPLRPGSRIELQLEGDVRGGMIAAHVTRCVVSAIHPESGVTYRAALSFGEPCDWVREATTHGGYAFPQAATANASSAGHGGHALPGRATSRADRQEEGSK